MGACPEKGEVRRLELVGFDGDDLQRTTRLLKTPPLVLLYSRMTRIPEDSIPYSFKNLIIIITKAGPNSLMATCEIGAVIFNVPVTVLVYCKCMQVHR